MYVCIYIYIYIHVHENIYIYIYIYVVLCTSRMPHKVNFKAKFNRFNSEFYFSYTGCHTKVKQPTLFYYLPIAGARILGFKPFPRVLALGEMLTALSLSLSLSIYIYIYVLTE